MEGDDSEVVDQQTDPQYCVSTSDNQKEKEEMGKEERKKKEKGRISNHSIRYSCNHYVLWYRAFPQRP